MNKFYRMLSFVFSILPLPLFAQVHEYGVPANPWDESLGNHRAVLLVEQQTDAAHATVYWRRRDQQPESKRLLLLDENGRVIRNLKATTLNSEKLEMVFEPVSGAGRYYLYYMPYTGKKNVGWWEGAYLKPEQTAEKDWTLIAANTNQASKARVEKIESRTAFDSFFPMEVCATESERTQLIRDNGAAYLLFPEDRKHPIRMTKDLPQKWIAQGPSKTFSGKANRNEYYAFQIGVFASRTELKNVRIRSSNPFVTCFNTEGVDARGKSFTKSLVIPKGAVQTCWMGVDIPRDFKAKDLRFKVEILVDNEPPQWVDVEIEVDNTVLEDRGDGEPWRHSRLRWLNSRLGLNDDVVRPYSALKQKGKCISGKTARLLLNELGLPQEVGTVKNTVTAAPIEFQIETNNGKETLQPGRFRFTHTSPGKITWQAEAETASLTLLCNGSMEFDGTILYELQWKASKPVQIKDIRLVIPVKESVASYFMGMGLPGGVCPANYEWKWKGPQDSYWIGAADAGMHVELQGATYSAPLLNLYKPAPPASWYNGNQGGFTVARQNGEVLTTTYSGARALNTGDSLSFQFKLLVTPVKVLDTRDQFVNRYYHDGNKPAPQLSDLEHGIKITNVHHANSTNPFINYPFIAVDSMRQFVNYWHNKGLKVKIYYTIRELTNQLPELWALRSLGNEIFADGKGGGYPWLQEHLINSYDVQWFTEISGYEASDASILTSGESRWYNYYIEGLRWLVKNLNIDGLYLDDVSFDRTMLQRMRRVMDEVKPGCLIDLHSNTGFSKGPATQYTEYFPYINKLWFGESFQYDKMPAANWMVEVSGIPFGLMGDMLHGGGNPWLGLVYGMTVRYPWGTEGVTCDPRDIWTVMDAFNIKEAKMIGYWDKQHPIETGNPTIRSTVYRQKGKTLLALGSWSEQTETIQLKINWKSLGLNPSKVKLHQPAIEKFQPAATYSPDDPIPVPAGKGVLLEIK